MNTLNPRIDIGEFHWLLEVLQNIDIGLVVLDRDYRVEMWNTFMFNHSGISPSRAMGSRLFELFPELPEQWLRHKVESVFLLNNRAFTIWEQRPYLFKFRNYRPVTGTAPFMYQNITLLPLTDVRGAVGHVCLIVYDVTDIAVSKQASQRANAELERLSRTDRLTGLNNRGYWEECLEERFCEWQRRGEQAALVLFDIDHFKRFNDTHGHLAGDEVLRVVAAQLRRNLRTSDIGGRYGGEEFGALLTGTDAAAAAYFAERLRKSVEAVAIAYAGAALQVTISVGVRLLDPELSDHRAWIEAADQALYRSKAAGRNTVTLVGG